MSGLQVMFAGSCFDSVRLAPDGVSETLVLWLQTAGFSGITEYRAIDRPKGTGTMACVHAKGVRDGLFVSARIRPPGKGNESVWVVSIPAATLGVSADELFTRLKEAEPTVNGDEDKFLAARLRRLFTYLDGQSIDLDALDLRIVSRSMFETRELLGTALESASLRGKFVKKTGSGHFEWRKGMKRVEVPSLVQDKPEPTELERFIYESDEDARLIVRQLFSVCDQIDLGEGHSELRLRDELPILAEEYEHYFPALEAIGLITSVGPNPNGPHGQSWQLDQSLWILAVATIGAIFGDAPESDSDSGSGEYELDPEASRPPSDPLASTPPLAPVPLIDELLSELRTLETQRADAETLERDITGKQSKLRRSQTEIEQTIAAGQAKLEDIRLQLSELDMRLREINETIHLTNAQIPALEERISAMKRESADHLAETLVGLIEEEAGKLRLSSEAIVEAIRRRLKP